MEMVEGDQKRLKIDETLEENREEEEDRISALPDFLILQILSLLPDTKDAIKTGTLSKRWKSLWTSIPTLIFIHSGRNQSTSDFVSFVNKTLTQCSSSKLNKFELYIRYRYDIQLESQINDWIRYAISRNVEQLNLESQCVLGGQFFINSCFSDLKLEGCTFIPDGAIRWKMLRKLCILGAYLDEDLMENILSGSPVLETLELKCCHGYKRLDISSKSVKNLLFCGYGNPYHGVDDGDVIEINAPNILSLKIHSGLLMRQLLLLDVSSLVEAELNYTKLGYCETNQDEAKEEALKGLIQSLHHVKELNIGIYCSKVLSRLEAKGFSSPANIQRLLGWK